tara:strand:+ start:164 stop:376 length:213 start_codon:yes stop_codon:yes gene_type:complete
MKLILIMYVCSTVGNTCMPPLEITNNYTDIYSCNLDGYKKSVDMLEEIGREEVNKYDIYTKFICKEITET